MCLVVLSKIRELNEEALAHEIHEMKIEQQDSEAENQDSWSIGRALADKTLLLPLLLVCSLQAGQQLSGINAVSVTTLLNFNPNALIFCRCFSILSLSLNRLICRT